MPTNHLSLVNQKLAFAGSTIRLLNVSSGGGGLEQQALCDAAAFHLMTALHFYLRELAGHQNIKNLSMINTMHDLATTLEQANKISPELSELVRLAQAEDTWLNQLLHYYEQLSKAPEMPKQKKAFGQENQIELMEIDSPLSLQLNAELLSFWLDSFRGLIGRQRETSAEF